MSGVLTAQEPSAKYLVNLQPPLVRHFDLIAQAPGGVARLRELILTLAVQGKLVPQDPSDEPASELLKKIAFEKDRLIAEKKIRKGKSLPDIGDDEKFFELPRTWAWVRLNSIGDWGAGATPSRTNSNYYGGKIPWFKSGELTSDHIVESEETVTEAALRECSLRLNQPGDVLIAMYGATIGKTAILDVVGTTNQAVCACTPFSGMSNTYLLLLMKALKPYFISQGAGGAQPNISREKVINTVIGLPPLTEQSRIVTRVEELMQLCDALEAQGQLEAEQHARLVSTLFASLLQSDTPEALADNWQRIATHFDVLLDRPEAVDALEQTILQLAVRGLLVPQDPTDEPASVLLQKIRTEKDRLIAQGKIKRDKPLPPITDEEKPFELPQGWGFTRFGFVAQSFYTGLDRGRDQQAPTRAYAYFKMNNISNDGHVNFENMTRVDASDDEVEKFSLKEEDFLFNTRNSRELVGKTCVINKLPEHHVVFNNNILVVRFFDEVIPTFVHYFFKSTDGKKLLDAMKSATTNVCAIYQGNLLELICPIPPYREQVRIVTRVNELRSLCADLREKIVNSRGVMENLSKALVSEV